MPKKALIITYYWPPAGGPGVQRWLKFVKYLPGFNVEPIVYIPENPSYPLVDNTLVSEVGDQITILKHPIREPYKIARLFSKKSSKNISKGIILDRNKQSFIDKVLLYIRGNFFIPDARKNWVKPSVSFLSDYIVKHSIDVIITTGPPHSLHLIGLQLKNKLNVKWLADFRDPWTTIGYHKQLKLTKQAQRQHKKLEKQVLTTANTIIVTSSITKNEFKKITNQPIHVITNGFDDEDVANENLDSRFSLAHIGSLLSKRNPKVLWRVLRDIIKTNSSFSHDFELNFVGEVSREVLNLIEENDLIDYVNNVGYVSHKEAIVFQKKSQLLLLIEIDSEETKCIIPGKLFEYMVSGRPILAFGPRESDVERIIKETQTGYYFDYNDYQLLKTVILKCYETYKNEALQSHAIGLQKYSRKKLTESLSKLI